jgi:hypothetical protein
MKKRALNRSFKALAHRSETARKPPSWKLAVETQGSKVGAKGAHHEKDCVVIGHYRFRNQYGVC